MCWTPDRCGPSAGIHMFAHQVCVHARTLYVLGLHLVCCLARMVLVAQVPMVRDGLGSETALVAPAIGLSNLPPSPWADELPLRLPYTAPTLFGVVSAKKSAAAYSKATERNRARLLRSAPPKLVVRPTQRPLLANRTHFSRPRSARAAGEWVGTPIYGATAAQSKAFAAARPFIPSAAAITNNTAADAPRTPRRQQRSPALLAAQLRVTPGSPRGTVDLRKTPLAAPPLPSSRSASATHAGRSPQRTYH